MTSVFKETLNVFITVSKIVGLMNFCCTMESGLLCRNTKSEYYFFLECARMFVYLICSYHVTFNMQNYILIHFNIVKYWAIIITARISEKWIIKFINGIIEFDSKLLLFNSLFPVKLYSIRKIFWNIIFGFYVLFFVFCQLYIIAGPYGRSIQDLSHCVTVLFHPPDIIIFVVLITSLYYLSNLGYRFCELNRLWKCLPFGLFALLGGWTNSEITMLVERIRLLHAELSELLRLFSLGYGPVLLVYFTFTFTNALLETFFITILMGSPVFVFSYVFYLQHIFNMISIICVTSWVIEKKKKIISYLRLIRISEMTVHTKSQIKIFMHQISMYEPNEITAFGFFNFDLKLTMSVLVLLLTAISTMLQMKDHPWMLYLKNTLIEKFNYIEDNN